MAKFDGSKPGPGRPKGSRPKLAEAFIHALHNDFVDHGVAAIEHVRTNDPTAYVKVVASILPKEFKIETVNDLTDEQLDARIRQLASALEVGISGAVVGTSAPGSADKAKPLSALH